VAYTAAKISGFVIAFWLFMGFLAQAQTNCAMEHATTGIYICYPNPADNPLDAVIPASFHLSAQGNAPGGKTITHFKVMLDDHLVYENWAIPPVQKLSVETNLSSPFDSGVHTLEFAVDGVGTAEVKALKIVRLTNATFCDPFFRADRRTCIGAKRAPLQWSLTKSPRPTTHTLEEYSLFVNLFVQNLTALEADASDAVAIDAEGNLYVASHVFSDLEIRKFTPTGSIVYDSLIRSCGTGFVSVMGLAVDDTGRAWIAANTNACFLATPGTIQNDISDTKQTRGLVVLVDTTKPSARGPLYVTYLSNVDYEIAGIRVDPKGNVYLAGTTGSPEYPHESTMNISDGPELPRSSTLGFVSALNSSGSGLQWSTLLDGTQLTSLALDNSGNVYVTGRVVSIPTNAGAQNDKGSSGRPTPSCDPQGGSARACDDMLIAEITDRGHKLSYAARLGGSGDQEGRAISLSPHGDWVFVTGDTDSSDFPASGVIDPSQGESQRSIAIAMQPCNTGAFDARFIPSSATVPPIVFGFALDRFASAQRFDPSPLAMSVQERLLSIKTAPPCFSDR
jgi:Beta-propeller repeat